VQEPETDVVIKDGRILLDCKACGQRTDVDLRLKLSGFILKTQTKKGKKDKASKRLVGPRRENGDAEENGNGHGGSPGDSNSDNADAENGDVDVEAGSDDELTRRINAEAKEIDHPTNANNDEWAVDVSEAAVKAAPKNYQTTSSALSSSKMATRTEKAKAMATAPHDQLGSWIISSADDKAGGVSELDDVDIYVKAKELGIENKHKTLTVLAQTIFDDNIVRQIPKRGAMLKKVRHLHHPLMKRH
jgi:translation initiation factor 5